MLNIKIFKDYLPNFSSIIQLRSYRHFKIRSYTSLEGRTAAAEILLILKLSRVDQKEKEGMICPENMDET